MSNQVRAPRATLEQKVAVLDFMKQTGSSQLATVAHFLRPGQGHNFQFSRATLSTWIMDEPNIRKEYSRGASNIKQYKKKPVMKYPQLNSLVEQEIKQNFTNGQRISDQMIKETFNKFIIELGLEKEDIRLSSGMLTSFKRRNGIFKGTYHGNGSSLVEGISSLYDGVSASTEQQQHHQVQRQPQSQQQDQPNTSMLSMPIINDDVHAMDFEINDIFSTNDIGFSTKLIHSDDHLMPFLHSIGAIQTPQIEPQYQNSQRPPLQEDSDVSPPLPPQASSVIPETGSNLVAYPTYNDPFHSSHHYQRRHVNNSNEQQHILSVKQSNPNSEKIEKILETITEGKVTLYNSGTSAIMGLLTYINPKIVYIDDNGYKGTHKVISLFNKLTGVIKLPLSSLNSQSQLDNSVIILESPQNPLGTVKDIGYYSREFSNKCSTCKLLVDSTLAPPPLQFPFKFGADYIVYSAVKYLAGVSDLSAGFVVCQKSSTNDKALLHELRSALGTSIGNFDSFLLLRSLRTYRMRIITQCSNAENVVKYLWNNLGKYSEVINKIHHSSLQEDSAMVKNQLNGYYNPVFGLEMKDDWMVQCLLNGFKFLSNNPNLEGGESLVEKVQGHPNFSSSSKDVHNLIRFSIGCEDFKDIIRDIDQSLMTVVNKKLALDGK